MMDVRDVHDVRDRVVHYDVNVNDRVMDLIPGEETISYSADSPTTSEEYDDVPVEFLPKDVENPVKPEGWKLPLRGRRPVGIEILESDYHESSRSNSVSYQKEARKTPNNYNNSNNNRKRKVRSRNFDSRSMKSPKYSRNVTPNDTSS